ncbi:MAG: PEP-CTERM sorting domain-containing protein [Pirellulales bacterium]|nr:PEP-CTERM sorting domain-containing protein [Pirellulales bacterium]
MSKKYCTIVLSVVAVLAFALTATARAELLFQDNFNNAGTPTATDYARNGNLSGRLSGSLITDDPALLTTAWGLDKWTTYYSHPVAVQVNNASFNGTDAMVMKYSSTSEHHGAVVQHDFTDQKIKDAGGFTVRFDLDPISKGSPANANNGYGAGFFIGGDDATLSTITSATKIAGRYDPGADLAIHVRESGEMLAYFHGQGNVGTAIAFDDSPATGPDWDKMYSFELRVTLDGTHSFVSTQASAELLWLKNGTWTPIDLNGAGEGTNATWTWDADGSNYLGFYEYVGVDYLSKFDNLAVYTGPNGVPEPSTIALLATGLIGLLAYAWRKRK